MNRLELRKNLFDIGKNLLDEAKLQIIEDYLCSESEMCEIEGDDHSSVYNHRNYIYLIVNPEKEDEFNSKIEELLDSGFGDSIDSELENVKRSILEFINTLK